MIAVNIDYTFPSYILENKHLYRPFFRFNSPEDVKGDLAIPEMEPLRIFYVEYWRDFNVAQNFFCLMLEEFKIPYVFDPKSPEIVFSSFFFRKF